jgi:hypothetical protein
MLLEPPRQGLGRTIGQEIDHRMGLQVDEDGIPPSAAGTWGRVTSVAPSFVCMTGFGVVEREKAALGVLITMREPTAEKAVSLPLPWDAPNASDAAG